MRAPSVCAGCVNRKRFDVRWAYNREVAAIQRRNRVELQSLGDRDDRGVGAAEWKIRVLLDEVSHPSEVARK